MNIKIFSAIILFSILGASQSFAQQTLADCKAFLAGDTLIISNSQIERKWIWNKGDIVPVSLTDLTSGKRLAFNDMAPSFFLADKAFIENTAFEVSVADKTFRGAAHLKVIITGSYTGLDLMRVFKIYPDIAAISCDVYLKYNVLDSSSTRLTSLNNGIERVKKKDAPQSSYLDRYPLSSRHWTLTFTEFKDMTDGKDNLVFEKEVIPYFSREEYQGNLVVASDIVSGSTFYILKEAPNTTSQINYPGHDFVASNSMLNIPVSGFADTSDKDWVKGYSTTVGVPGESGKVLFSLRKYMKGSINYDPATYEMIMMNTWGDRGQDGKISESFILNELEGAERLGISHFQIDDGWQQGLSANSSDKSGNLWDAWTAEDWEPNLQRFPNGWERILKSAKQKNIRLGLWFHPTNSGEYARWKEDAEVIIGIFKKYGIRYFKIDGIKIPTKKAEVNLRKFFDEVQQQTDGRVFFNLDLTADVRGGYHMFRNTGNLFLENRYTDWGRYYPFHTLRNLWMLSKYFPPELLQIEFLNKWRNPGKYPANDPFAPLNYGFDYVFAISAMAQPLAWLETANLPAEAYKISPFISKYRSIMADMHQGIIVPLGSTPNGRSWTGFQSLKEDSGYFLIFRERNEKEMMELKTMMPSNSRVRFEIVYCSNQNGAIKALPDNFIEVKLPAINSFILVRYTTEN